MDKQIYPKYYRCTKCGESIIKVDSLIEQLNSMCTLPVTYRTSGICGGSISLEITEKEYNEMIKNWEK